MNKTYIKISALAISLLYVDLFCGAGGTSTGVESARVAGNKTALVVSCVNHDANAIASHFENHPNAQHFTEDIRTLDIAPLAAHVSDMRKKYPFAKLILWASLECTNHSNAKGGMSRDADSRTLAEHVNRYVISLNPDCVQIENVREFMDWGPLKQKEKEGEKLFCKKGNPIMSPDPEFKGSDYQKWIESVKNLGYSFDYRILNSADFNAYTSRRRYFAQFSAADFPVVWPEPTNSKDGKSLPKWNAVKHCLDFSEEGISIFGRKKPLVEKTLERIYAGLVKFVADGDSSWILKYNSSNSDGTHNPPSVNEPCPVVATQNRLGKVQVNFLSKYFSGNPSTKNISVESPAGAITTVDHHSLITTNFLAAYYGTGENISSIENPSPVITTKDRISKVSCSFIDQQFGKSKPASIEDPIGTLTVNPNYAKVDCNFFLMNPQYNSAGGSVEDPSFTLIARMDKMPPHLVQTDCGNIAIQIFENDSPMMIKIKKFMAAHGISDIKMRMLFILELKKIMGFPENYVLIGNQADQKKFIGNAVEVNVAKAMCEATARRIHELKKVA
ncbi:MAG: DNA cytosine methyltransferase [Kaistella sp.]